MNRILCFWILLIGLLNPLVVFAAEPNLDVNTPTVGAIKSSMQGRHSQLQGYYAVGAVGFTGDGFIAIKDSSAVPLKDRGGLSALVAAENADRANLYKEIATANGHPEWQGEIQNTFAGRWIDKAQTGWFYQKSGTWIKK
jgi:uncharacterized protein